MTDKESQVINELTEINDDLYEGNQELKDAVLELQGIIIAYQRKHIAELEDNDYPCLCDECLSKLH